MGSQVESRFPAQLHDNEMLHLIVNSIPVGISYFDRDQRFRFANEEYRRFLGASPADLISKTLREMIGEKPYRTASKYAKRALAGETVTFDNTLPTKDGGEISINVTYTPHIGPDGKVEGFFADFDPAVAINNWPRVAYVGRVRDLAQQQTQHDFEWFEGSDRLIHLADGKWNVQYYSTNLGKGLMEFQVSIGWKINWETIRSGYLDNISVSAL